MQLDTAIQAYETDDLLKLAASTRRTYHQALHVIAGELGPSLETHLLNRAALIDLAKHVLGRRYARSTATIYSTVTLHLVDYLLREDLVVISPADMLKIRKAFSDLRPPVEGRLPVVPAPGDVRAIVAAAYAADRPTPLKQRDIAFLEILASTGMRIQEIADLRCGQVDLDSGHAIITGKRRKQRAVYLSPAACRALTAYWTARGSSAKAAPALGAHGDQDSKNPRDVHPIQTHGLRYVFNDLAEAAGVTGLTPHKFRHAFATGLQKISGDVTIVQEALGHADIRTTMIYTHVDPTTVQEAVRQLHRQ